jgi:hypothetical protein
MTGSNSMTGLIAMMDSKFDEGFEFGEGREGGTVSITSPPNLIRVRLP